MFKIGEFSKMAQVSIRMLRYYDEQGILEPAFINGESGYRLYSAEQLFTVNQIVKLRDMGFSIKEIQEYIICKDTAKRMEYLQLQVQKTEQEITAGKERLLILQGYLSDLNKSGKEPELQIVNKKIPSCFVISLRRVVENYYGEAKLWGEMQQKLRGSKINMQGDSFTIYHDLDYREEQVDIEICLTCEEPPYDLPEGLIYRQVQEVPYAACFMIYGPYSSIAGAYRQFAFWLENHPEYQMKGENRQICHVTACHTANPAEYVTEMQIPLCVKEKNA